MNRLFCLSVLILSVVSVLFSGIGEAQTSTATSLCSAYLATTDVTQQALFSVYLEGYADANNADPRFAVSNLILANDERKIREWCGKNPQSSYAAAVAAVIGPTSRGAASSFQPAPTAPQFSEPSACTAGATQACAGCRTSCVDGRKAACRQGQDSADRKTCSAEAACECR